MIIPGKNKDDGKVLDTSVLDTIFGCGSFRASVFKKINEGATTSELAELYGFTEEEIQGKYFSAYVRYDEYQKYKNKKSSVRYLKAVRKLNKKTALTLLKAGVNDMTYFENRTIGGNALEMLGEEGIENIVSVCGFLGIPVKVIVNPQKEDIKEQDTKETELEKKIKELVNLYGADAVADASRKVLAV